MIMKTILRLLIPCILLPLSIQAAPIKEMPTVDQFIIKYYDPSVKINDVVVLQKLSTQGVQLRYVREMSGYSHILKAPNLMTQSEAESFAKKLLKSNPAIEYIEPDKRMKHFFLPNDPEYVNQWNHSAANGMNAEAAWDTTQGSATSVIAVIDTGYLPHTDLYSKILPGVDMISDIPTANDGNGRDADPSDPGDADAFGPSSWHGTHVAGIAAASSNNNTGITGVDWNANILPVRVLGVGGGLISDIVDGITWAYGGTVPGIPVNPNPADVMNMSLGGSGSCSASEQAAIDGAVAAGTVVVIAAGNESSDVSGSSPANCNHVITVAAHGPSNNMSYYSNFGDLIDIMAPGGDQSVAHTDGILSTLDSGLTAPVNDNAYVYYQGTSMAAPHVAGLVSLIVSVNPALAPSQISLLIQQSAKAFPAGTNCADGGTMTGKCGAGIADASAAVLAANPATIGILPPLITLVRGDLNISQGSIFADPGFSAADIIDGDLTANVVVTGGPVNTNATIGTVFTLSYNVSDTATNPAVTKIRNITILGPDTFPVGGVIPSGWTQSAGAAFGWTVDKVTQTTEGTMSLRANPAMVGANNKTAAIEVRKTTVAGNITFNYKVSSELDWDFFKFYIDGVQKIKKSGATNWLSTSLPVSAGEHTYKWEYIKDESVSSGDDTAWIDKVSFPAATSPSSGGCLTDISSMSSSMPFIMLFSLIYFMRRRAHIR